MSAEPIDIPQSSSVGAKSRAPFDEKDAIKYPVKKLSRCDISKSKNVDYRHVIMDYVSAKNGTFVGIDFSYSIMTDCYFHKASFVNCKFIGARLYRCNFRGARFENCRFDYIDANETRIPSDEIFRCLPDEPNISKEICQVLRRNANSLGDISDSRRYVVKELNERKEHYRRAIRGQGSYYNDKYKGITKKIELYVTLFLLNSDSFLWGHGEKIWKILLPIILAIAGSAVIQTLERRPSVLNR